MKDNIQVGIALAVGLVCGWWGKTGDMVAAMLKVGFIVECDEGYLVNDWLDHQGHLAMFKERAKKAANKRWGTKTDALSNALSNAQASPKQCPNQLTNQPTNQLTNQLKDPPENLAGFSKEFVEKAEKAKAVGFNIYQLSGSFYKQSNLSDKLPEAVLSAVLDEFEKRGESVEDHWPYFLRVLKSKSAEYFANKNIQDSVKFNDKFAFSVAEVLAGMAKH
jgi:hypothetical protein